MNEKVVRNQTKRKILFCLIIFIIVAFDFLIIFTSARYIKRSKDEIIAHYTSLYLDSTGENRVVTLENNVGYIDFKLMNYIDDNVTQRDIVYTINTPSVFYDENGNVINATDYGTKDLYVLDVWKKPQLVGKDSYKYNISVVKNTGEKVADEIGKYLFSYEKKDNVAIGKTHNITLKFERNHNSILNEEKISVVVQLEKPYKEVHIFNITVSNRLIGFATADKVNFDIDYRILYIQSINSYGFVKKDTNDYASREFNINGEIYTFTSNPIKLTITWNGLMLDQNIFHRIHSGRIGRGNYEGDFDINDPYIYSIESNLDSGTMIIYIPQSSNFYIEFLKYSNLQEINVKIEVNTNKGYKLYDNSFNGYDHSNGHYEIYKNTEDSNA